MIAFLDLIDDEDDKIKFTGIYNQYRDLLMVIALKKLGNNKEDAEECVQETFFYVAKHFNRLKTFKDDNLKSYIITAVSGFAVSKIRENQRQQAELWENFDNVVDMKTLDNEINRYNSLEISEAMDRLSELDRIYLYMTYIYGYNSKELAEMYKTSDAYVRKRIQLAKRDIIKFLQKDG